MAATAHRVPVRDHVRTRPARPAPRAPRRVSGPARAHRPPRAIRPAAGAVTLPAPTVPRGARALDLLRGLPDARWLDRLLRGQGWIVLIAVALIGIVALQVSLLKLNAGIGRSIEHAGTLDRRNADLRAEVSKLSSEERIQEVAGRLGLVMPQAGDVRFVRAQPGTDGARAAKAMRAPDGDPLLAAAAVPAGATAEAIAQGQPVPPTTVTPAAATTAPVAPAPTPAPTGEAAPVGQSPAVVPASDGTTAASGATTPTAPGH